MAGSSPRPAIRVGAINMDCREPEVLVAFYGALLGWEVRWRDHDFVVLGNPDGGPNLSFQEYADYVTPVWPEEPGEQWKMIHLDFQVEDVAAATEHALACGALLAEYQGRDDLRVLLDPAGHPFCFAVQ